MPVTYVITFDITPGQRTEFLDLLNPVLDAMREESTFIEAVLHADPEDADRMLLYETWESHQDVTDVQVNRPYRAAFHAALDQVLRSPRDISMWTPVRTDRR